MTTKKPAAPRAEYADKAITPTMQAYAAWLTEQTGYPVDPRSVFIGSALRVAFQQGNREAKAATLASITVPAKPKRVRTPKAATTEAVAE